jgi:hypothetical protein
VQCSHCHSTQVQQAVTYFETRDIKKEQNCVVRT